MAVLHRSSGPSGSTTVASHSFQLAGWELFEGEPGTPNHGRGWFAIKDPEFNPKKKTRLHLDLLNRQGEMRDIDVTVVAKDRNSPLWEFQAE